MHAVAQPLVVKTASVKAQNNAAQPKTARPAVSRKPIWRFLDFLMVVFSAPAI